ncbi:hypothetical protein M9Y10_042003 [Tritrichomonas musculus]|uniref:Ankyrin repeat protein n=1 Tax=Tritrichomonas musculus TaxID=1915356 RepID=A0ABR2K644_9EUKA
MNIDSLLHDYSSFFKTRIYLQNKILKINESNVDELKKKIKDSGILNNKSNCRFVLDALSSAFYARPGSFDFYIDIIDSIKEDIQKYFTSDELFFDFFILNNARLKLYQIGLIDLTTFAKIREVDTETIIFFSPEILKLIETQPDMMRGTYFKKIKSQIIKYSEKIKSNEIARHSTISFSEDKISKIIESDSISEFQSIISQTNLSINSKIQLSDEVQFVLPSNNPSLIEYSMFFNSIEIFKFLLLNSAQMDKCDSPCFAVAGGSYDVIHQLEQKNIIADNKTSLLINIAIRYHRNEIVDYLNESLGFGFDFESLASSIRYNNYYAFTKTVQMLKSNPNERSADFETALYICVNFGRIEFLKFLSHVDGIDFNAKSISVEWSPLHLAASYNQLETIKYLCTMNSSSDESNHEKDKTQNSKAINSNNQNSNMNNNDQSNKTINNNDQNNSMNNNNQNNSMNNNNQNNSMNNNAQSNKTINNNDQNNNMNNNNQNNSMNNNAQSNKTINNNDQNSNMNNNDQNNNLNNVDGNECRMDEAKKQDGCCDEDDSEADSDGDSFDNVFISDSPKVTSSHDRFIDVNVKSISLMTPLHLAASNGFAEVVSFLCSLKDVNVNATNIRGETPLHFAATSNIEMVKNLCSRTDINVNAVNVDGETPLFFAIKKEDVEIVKFFLSLPGIDKNVVARNGQTPVSLALKRFNLYRSDKCYDIYFLLK